LETFLQIWVVLSGIPAIYLLSCGERWMRWGFVLGLLSQPAWILSFFLHKQYGMIVLSFFYSWSWGRGVWKYFRKKI
jgi:hypothetical protein